MSNNYNDWIDRSIVQGTKKGEWVLDGKGEWVFDDHHSILTEADIAKTNLASKGVLVRLAITKWSGVKTSKKVAEKIAEDNGIPINRVRGVLEILGRDYVILTRNPANKARTFLNDHTSPFDDLGWRFLPSDLIEEVKVRLEEEKELFEDGIKIVLKKYDEIRKEAEEELDDFWDDSYFPDKDEIKDLFKWEGDPWLITSIEDADAIRSLRKSLKNYDHLSGQVLEEIEQGILKRHEKAMKLIDKNVQKKLSTQLDNFIEKVESFNPDPEDGRKGNTLRKNTLDKLVKEGQAIKKNLTGNPDNDVIAEAVADLVKLVGDFDSFKGDTGEAKQTRKKVVAKAKETKKKITKVQGSVLGDLLGGNDE
jgi:hypothetical protein